MSSRCRRAAGALVSVLCLACAGSAWSAYVADADEPEWQEDAFVLPAFPADENLLPFYVSAGTSHQYFVDGASISAGGKDGVVRFTLVVKTSGGATNVSFEGLRCGELQYRFYAAGRADGTWAKARNSEWKRIENRPINRYHAVLSRDFFCPSALPIRSAEEGREALKRGRHPDAK